MLHTATPQYEEDTLQYAEMLENGNGALVELLKSNEAVEDYFYPARSYFNRDQYMFEVPHAMKYAIGLIADTGVASSGAREPTTYARSQVDPCVGNPYDCCMNWYGSPAYARGAEIDASERRRADDETFLAEECESAPEDGEVMFRLESNGELVRTNEFSHCQGTRLGMRPFPIQPYCSDNNATVNASASCFDVDGTERPNCVQVAFTQTAMIINCGEPGSPNNEDFSQHPHCGTFIELHRENGSPYNPDESFVINEKRIDTALTTGYTTTTIDLAYGIQVVDRIACNYEESTMRARTGASFFDRSRRLSIDRPAPSKGHPVASIDGPAPSKRHPVGSMVYIKESSPECCCPPGYNNELKTGTFFCPKNMLEDTAGPYSNRLSTLNHYLAKDEAAAEYPYCPTLEEDQDTLQCSNFTDAWGGRRYYNTECPKIGGNNETGYYDSPYLVGKTYGGKCFYWPGCSAHPHRTGSYGEGGTVAGDLAYENDGCAHRCEVNDIANCPTNDMDTHFSFQGLLGKITCMPTDKEDCVNMALDQYDEDSIYYLVTFNDNRTNYAFRSTDLELHQPRHNYQLWWVQRTRYNFIVQKKKAIRVTEPTCTFDSINDRYFPYTIIRPDGSYIDTL
ncbi:hypothetical protein JL720_11208 [Aureococcus anophagefferens]|nr:hypothetical protein JL720_11208 [Aureococcus anophagefferens]